MTDEKNKSTSSRSAWEVRPIRDELMHFTHLVEKYREEFSRLCQQLQKEKTDRHALELRLKAALSAEKYERARAEVVLVTAEQYVALEEKARQLRVEKAKLEAENKELQDKAQIDANMLEAKYAAWERSAKESQRRTEAEQQVAREVAKEAQLRLENEKEALKQAAKRQEEEMRRKHEEEVASLRRKHEEEVASLQRELQCLRTERDEEINVLVLEHEHRVASQMDSINTMDKTIQKLRAELSSTVASVTTQAARARMLKARLEEEQCKHSAETLRLQETNRTLMLQLQSATQQASSALPTGKQTGSVYPQLSVARQRTRQTEKHQADPSGAPSCPTRPRRQLFESDQTFSFQHQPLHEQIINRRHHQRDLLQEQRHWMGLPETVNDPWAHPITKPSAFVCKTLDRNQSSPKPPVTKAPVPENPVGNTALACPSHAAERCIPESKANPPLLVQKSDFLSSPEHRFKQEELLCLEDINFLACDDFGGDLETVFPSPVSSEYLNPFFSCEDDKTRDRSSEISPRACSPLLSATASVQENCAKRKADLAQGEKPSENPSCRNLEGAASEDRPTAINDLLISSKQQVSPLTLSKAIRAVKQSVKNPKDPANLKSKANLYFPRVTSKIPPVQPVVDSPLLSKQANMNNTNCSKYTNTIPDAPAKGSTTHCIEGTSLSVNNQIDGQINAPSSHCIEIIQLSAEHSGGYPTEESPISYSPLNDESEDDTNEETIATDYTLQGTATEGSLTASPVEPSETKSVVPNFLEHPESFLSKSTKGTVKTSKFVLKRPTIFLTQHGSKELRGPFQSHFHLGTCQSPSVPSSQVVELHDIPATTENVEDQSVDSTPIKPETMSNPTVSKQVKLVIDRSSPGLNLSQSTSPPVSNQIDTSSQERMNCVSESRILPQSPKKSISKSSRSLPHTAESHEFTDCSFPVVPSCSKDEVSFSQDRTVDISAVSQDAAVIDEGEVSQGTEIIGNEELSQDCTQDCRMPLLPDSFTLEKPPCQSTGATTKSSPISTGTCAQPLCSVSIAADDVLKTCNVNESAKETGNGLLQEVVFALPIINEEREGESSVIGSLSPGNEGKADLPLHSATRQCTVDSTSSPRPTSEAISPPNQINLDSEVREECLQIKPRNSHSSPSVSTMQSAKSPSEILAHVECINESKSQDPDATVPCTAQETHEPNSPVGVITLKYLTGIESPTLTSESSCSESNVRPPIVCAASNKDDNCNVGTCSTQSPIEIETPASESSESGYKAVNVIGDENEASKPLTSLQQLFSSYQDYDAECGVAPLPISGEGAHHPLESDVVVVDLPLCAINEEEVAELQKIREYSVKEILTIHSYSQGSASSSETASHSPTSKTTPKQIVSSKRKKTPSSTDRSAPKNYSRDSGDLGEPKDTGKPLRLRKVKKRRLFPLVDNFKYTD